VVILPKGLIIPPQVSHATSSMTDWEKMVRHYGKEQLQNMGPGKDEKLKAPKWMKQLGKEVTSGGESGEWG
jgi:hypothetical protein